MIVAAPAPNPAPQQPLQHTNIRDGVFVPYQGDLDDTDVKPIGAAFAISKKVIATYCLSQCSGEGGRPGLFRGNRIKSEQKAGKMCTCFAEEGNWSTASQVHRWIYYVDWAC